MSDDNPTADKAYLSSKGLFKIENDVFVFVLLMEKRLLKQ